MTLKILGISIITLSTIGVITIWIIIKTIERNHYEK